MRFKRFIILSLLPGVITILCHGNAFAPVNRGVLSLNIEEFLKPDARDDSGSTMEDTPVTINVLANDRPESINSDDVIDPATVDLNPPTVQIDNTWSKSAGNYSVNSTGDVTFSPSANFTGLASIKYTVNDIVGRRSHEADLRITVIGVNDPPVITGQQPDPLVTNEDQSITIVFNNLIVTDPDDNYPTGFTLSLSPGTNYTVSGNTITPVANYNGPLTVPVSVNDGTASSNTFDLKVTVTPVNDAPVITGQNPAPLVTNEDQAITLLPGNLLVTDPDDTYPTDFTMAIAGGTNYTVTGNSIAPNANFTGILSVPVTVNDGDINSNVFNVQITVSAINDAPVITGQNPAPLTTLEEQPLTIALTNLLVTDPDDSFPTDFTLSVGTGDNYTVSGSTITPAQNFSGMLSVPVTVNDGEVNSNVFSLQVNVTHVNEAPVITGQSVLSADEDNSIRITLPDLIVTDNDNNYPADFTLTLSAGSNYTLSGTTVIPSPNYSGSLSVPAVVSDGESNSAPFNVQITINPVNDVPQITGQATLSTNENQPIAISLSQLTIVDPDNTTFTLSILAGTNYSVSGSSVTPAPGFNGILSVGVFVNDGFTNSAIFNLQITVNAVNDAPIITGQTSLSVIEDNSLTIHLADLTVTDPDNPYPTGFSLAVLAGSNYTVNGASITPVANFTGALSVGVTVNDGISNSAPFNLTITVTPENDAPVITGQQTLSTSEDQPITIGLSNLIVSDPDNSFPSGFTLSVSAGPHYVVSGTTITPELDFSGTLSIPVQVSDGLVNSNVFALKISVISINDPPVITGQVPLSTQEDTPVAINLSHLTVFDSDNNYPTGFSLSISSGANYTVSGNTITPALDFNGTLNVNLTVSDGISSSPSFIFQIQVGDTNDPPTITGQFAVSTDEEKPFTLLLSHLTVIDPDNTYPNGFSLLVAPGEDYTLSGNTITPALNFSGVLTVPVRVNDGINNSATFNLKLQVIQINDAPSFDAIANVRISENAQPGKINITNISKGAGEDTQQLTFVVTSNNTSIVPNPVITYDGKGSSAQLSYSVSPNKSGVVTISVVAIDNGSNTPPNQNSYSSTFQIEIMEINSPPTLDAIVNLTIPEDAAEQNIRLTGITAGPGEAQTLTVEASSNKADLFESFQVNYVSPAAEGTLQFKTKPNAYGVATVTVKVLDNGSAIAPSINFFQRSFTLTVQPVNDPPVFISIPVKVAAINEPYNYLIEIKDEESESLPITASEKPSWATFTSLGAGKAKLSGVPPASATGSANVRLTVTDGGQTVEQQFVLVVNTRPTISSFNVTTSEDVPITFSATQFSSVYKDVNQHTMASIQITAMPVSGTLLLSAQEVKPNDTIPASSLSSLIYKPDLNYAGNDKFEWKASDGYHFSISASAVAITMLPVNDPPVITLETDSLNYEVNGEPAALTALFEINDPDNDSISHATLVFKKQNYQNQYDLLLFQNTPAIKGLLDYQTGTLSLTGKASRKEYERAVKSVQYNHLNTVDPLLKLKTVSITVSDGKLSSEEKDRMINPRYTFIELEIPTGFTPNGDNANDKWIITRPGGIEQLEDALIRVFNKRGIIVYQALGFDRPWDGTFNGEVLPADSYYFTIDLKLRSKKTYKGIVTILR